MKKGSVVAVIALILGCTIGSTVYSAAEVVSWAVLVNPAEDPTTPNELDGTLNPFSSAEVRFALNMGLDRVHYLSLYTGTGKADLMFTPVPLSRCCSGFYQAEAVGLDQDGDTNTSYSLIESAMLALGAEKNAAGVWSYNGEEVEITLVKRTDTTDGRAAVTEEIRDLLETAGFKVALKEVSKSGVNSLVYGSDPVNGGWHLYVEGWIGKADTASLDLIAQYYASSLYLPGWGKKGYYQYSNTTISQALQDVILGVPANGYERCDTLDLAVKEALMESVRIFLAIFE